MAEVINTNVFDATKKFVDFAGLDYFWDKAKAYVDGKVDALNKTIEELKAADKTNAEAIAKVAADLAKAQTDLEAADAALQAQMVGIDSTVVAKIAAELTAALKVDGVDKYALATDLSALAARVKALEDADLDTRVKDLEDMFGGTEGTVEDMIADAKQAAIDAAAERAEAHDLDLLAILEALGDDIAHRADGSLCILAGEASLRGDRRAQFILIHSAIILLKKGHSVLRPAGQPEDD